MSFWPFWKNRTLFVVSLVVSNLQYQNQASNYHWSKEEKSDSMSLWLIPDSLIYNENALDTAESGCKKMLHITKIY